MSIAVSDKQQTTTNNKMDFTGTKYDGEIKNGRMEGEGKFSFQNGIVYVGAMLDGMFHGFGTIHFPNGARMEGVFENGVLQPEQGTYFFSDNLRYETEKWGYCTREISNETTATDRRFYKEVLAALEKPKERVENDPSDGRAIYSSYSSDGIRPTAPEGDFRNHI